MWKGSAYLEASDILPPLVSRSFIQEEEINLDKLALPFFVLLIASLACLSSSEQSEGVEDTLLTPTHNQTTENYSFEIYKTDRVAGLIVPVEEYTEWNDLDGMTRYDVQKISKLIYDHMEDDFDFVFIISNNTKNPETIYSGRYFWAKNQIKGIGRPIFDSTILFGSSGRLMGVIHLPVKRGLMNGPSLHELMHAWGNYVLETSLQSHWGFSNIGGQLGGFRKVL